MILKFRTLKVYICLSVKCLSLLSLWCDAHKMVYSAKGIKALNPYGGFMKLIFQIRIYIITLLRYISCPISQLKDEDET